MGPLSVEENVQDSEGVTCEKTVHFSYVAWDASGAEGIGYAIFNDEPIDTR